MVTLSTIPALYLRVVHFVRVNVGDSDDPSTANQQTEKGHEPVRVPASTTSHVGTVCRKINTPSHYLYILTATPTPLCALDSSNHEELCVHAHYALRVGVVPTFQYAEEWDGWVPFREVTQSKEKKKKHLKLKKKWQLSVCN